MRVCVCVCRSAVVAVVCVVDSSMETNVCEREQVEAACWTNKQMMVMVRGAER